MAQLIINLHELVKNYIKTADDRSLAVKIHVSDELLQLSRAVVKKYTLPGERLSNITFLSQREC